jgi:hypothetical protein
MTDIPYKKEINPKTKARVVVIALIFIGLIVGLVASGISINLANEAVGNIDPDTQQFVRDLAGTHYWGISIICMDIFLLVGLILVYILTFRKTKSRFVFALLIFLGALLMKSIVSLPLLHYSLVKSVISLPVTQATLGSAGPGFGLIVVISYMFEILAMSVLLYLSME